MLKVRLRRIPVVLRRICWVFQFVHNRNRSHIIYVACTWRAHDLLILEQYGMVQWPTIACSSRNGNRRAYCQLCYDRSTGEDERNSAARPSIAQPSRSNIEGAKLPTRKCRSNCMLIVSIVRLTDIIVSILVSRGNVPPDQREYVQSRVLVVFDSSRGSPCLGRLANETFETILRNQKISLNLFAQQKSVFLSLIVTSFKGEWISSIIATATKFMYYI